MPEGGGPAEAEGVLVRSRDIGGWASAVWEVESDWGAGDS